MPFIRHLLLLSGSALLLNCGAAVAHGAQVDNVDFTNSLPAWAQNAAGLSHLSPAQLAALNTAVKHDISLAEQGDTTAFSGTFSARRTPEQRAALGLTQLNFDQVNRLDEDVAHAIAYRPRASVGPVGSTGSAPLVDAGAIAGFKRPWQTHGEVSMTVGGSKHSSFYGGSAEVEETDPSGNFTIAVGISELKGKGRLPCYGDDLGYGYSSFGYGLGRPYGSPYGW